MPKPELGNMNPIPDAETLARRLEPELKCPNPPWGGVSPTKVLLLAWAPYEHLAE